MTYNNISMREETKILIEIPVTITKEKNYYIAYVSNQFISQGKTKEKVLNNIKETLRLHLINEELDYTMKFIKEGTEKESSIHLKKF